MRILSVISLWLIAILASADHSHRETIFDLDLNELMEVTVASKKPETLDEAPSVVTVITRQHIQRYGATTLRDLIDRLPNTQVMGSSLYPDNRTSLRAVTQTHLDDKVLILLNGRPLRDAGQGGVNGDLYRTLPVDAIKQLEIIRGPGSVLYGTNAFAGVINVVTNDPNSTNAVTLRAGNGNDRSAYAQLGDTKGDITYQVSAQKVQHQGISYYGQEGEVGAAGQHKMGYDGDTLLFGVKGKHLSFQGLLNDTRIDSANNLQSYPSEDWDINRKFLDIGYEQPIGHASKLKLNLTYNEMQNKAYILSQSQGGPDSFFETDSTSYLLDAHIQSSLSENSGLLVGANFDQLSGDNVSSGTLNTDIDTWRTTLYAQVDYTGFNRLKLVGGGQYHETKEDHHAFSPRLMAIYSLGHGHTFKIGYDEAYRSPFGLDLFLEADFLQGNENLDPETIKTYTLNHTYRSSMINTGITYYQSRHEDLIVRNDTTDPVTLENAGHVDYKGIELDYQTKALHHHWQLEGNASYQENESDQGQEDVGIASQLMLKQGISYLYNQHSVGLFMSHFGEPTQASELSDNVSEVNEKPKAYTMVSLNIRSALESYTGIAGLSTSLFINNLLDQEIYYPEIARKRVNSFPLREGRTIYLQLNYQPGS